jgi:hypothetical protein
MKIDLHCHSMYSVDAWLTPEELAERAFDNGVTLMSLTDHNSIGGQARARKRAEELGMRYVTGLELDAFWEEDMIHLLCFNFDMNDAKLGALCQRQMEQETIHFSLLLPVLERRLGITEADLLKGLPVRYRTHPEPMLNKWFAQDFITKNKICLDRETTLNEVREALKEAEAGKGDPRQWASVEEVCEVVHAAGGIVLIAHVAVQKPGDYVAQEKRVLGLMNAGVDGFELYHRSNLAELHFEQLNQLAQRLACPVSGGSDFHNNPYSAIKQSGMDVPAWIVANFEESIKRYQ